MQHLMNAVLLSVLCSPILAQSARPIKKPTPMTPVPEVQITLNMSVFAQETVLIKLASVSGGPFLGMVIASVDDHFLNLPGLPPVLNNAVVLAAEKAPYGEVLIDLGKFSMPFPIYIQGIGLTNDRTLISDIDKLAP